MARSRNIKPSFFINDDLAELSPFARLLFIGLWCLADRDGRLEDKPRRIKVEILPYDDCDANALLDALHNAGFIYRYTVKDNRYIWIINFNKHQNPHVNEKPSTLPKPDEHHTSTVQEPDEHNTNPADSLLLIPDSGNLIPDSHTTASPDGDECDSADPVPVKPEYSTEFEHFWSLYPKRIEKKKAYKNWKARLKDKHSAEDMIQAATSYARFCTCQKTEPRFIKYAATFLGPDKPFLEFVNGIPPDARGHPPEPNEPAGFKAIREFLSGQGERIDFFDQ